MRRGKAKLDPFAKIPIELKAIPLLMARSKIPMQATLNPEEGMCVRFADLMREYTDKEIYKGIWLHIPNERKAHVFTMIILKAMGVITGAWDYVFIGPWGAGCLEFKQGANTLSDYQRYFRFWLRKWDIPHEEVRTVEQALQALKKWGALPEQLPKACYTANNSMQAANQSSLPIQF